MERTTLMLPGALKARASKLAHERGISFAELVRECLQLELSNAEKGALDPLFSDRKFYTKPTESDAAISHDKFLYE